MVADAEQRALRASVACSVASAALALLIGVASGIRIILFDGAYMLIGVMLSWASLRAAIAVGAGPTRRYPFGRDALAPLVVTVQGVAIGGTLLYAVGDAVIVIRDGGVEVAPAVIAAYGAVTAVVAAAAAWWLRRLAPDSDLVAAEAAQWRAGAVLSVVMTLGAIAALILLSTSWDGVVRYVDPVLVLIACAILAPVPVRLMRAGLDELLEAEPPPATAAEISRVLASVRERYGLGEPTVRATKLGRKLYLDVGFVVGGAEWDVTDEDQVRRAVLDGLSHLGLDVWGAISLTADPRLVE